MIQRQALTLPSNPGEDVTESELLHVVLTVAAALLNPGQFLFNSILYIGLIYLLAVHVDWDADQLMTRVKSLKPGASQQEEKLDRFFNKVSLGHFDEPVVLVGRFGCVLGWHLPDILPTARVVSMSTHLMSALTELNHRRRPTSLQSVFLTFFWKHMRKAKHHKGSATRYYGELIGRIFTSQMIHGSCQDRWTCLQDGLHRAMRSVPCLQISSAVKSLTKNTEARGWRESLYHHPQTHSRTLDVGHGVH